MALELNGYRQTSFTRTERELIREFATTTIFQSQLIQSLVADANKLDNEKQGHADMIKRYSEDLEAATARIGEDEATIAIKDTQLKNASSQIEDLTLDINTLKEELDRKNKTIISYENVITNFNSNGDATELEKAK